MLDVPRSGITKTIIFKGIIITYCVAMVISADTVSVDFPIIVVSQI